ncbi:uncharacterized protein [Littorina saxatilis]|uniref:Uncharacterized protein n=1 Tax=Littorina saxatilis TaxID=31220 RepID=A0AAN9G0P8_9CAEN
MLSLLGWINMMKFAGCILILALASPSYAASLSIAKAVAAGVDIDARMNSLLESRHVRSLNNAGGPADATNSVDPGGPVDAALGPVDAFLDKGQGGDSSEDIDSLIAQLENAIMELSALPAAEAIPLEERVAQLQETIAAKEAPAPEAAPEVQQEQAPAAPEPAAATGPDNSNKEDGDGDGNSGPDTGGGQQDASPQHDSGAGAPEAPAPFEPQQGNGVDQGNEDTKS